MKRSYRIIKVNQGDTEYFLVQKRYWILFWKTSTHFSENDCDNRDEFDIAFRNLEEAMSYLHRLKVVDSRIHTTVYSECNFL